MKGSTDEREGRREGCSEVWPDQWLQEEGPTKDISEFERQTGFLVERNGDLGGAMNAGVCLRHLRDRAARHSPDLLTSAS